MRQYMYYFLSVNCSQFSVLTRCRPSVRNIARAALSIQYYF